MPTSKQIKASEFHATDRGTTARLTPRQSASALDPDNASRYLAMVRRARALGGFHQVIYVAHLPELHEAADARVVFSDGKVRAA